MYVTECLNCLEFVYFYQQTFYLIFFYNPDLLTDVCFFLFSLIWILIIEFMLFDMWYNLIMYPLPF